MTPADPTKTSNEKFNPYFGLEKLVTLGGGCDVRSPEHGGGVASVLHGGDTEVLVGVMRFLNDEERSRWSGRFIFFF